MKASAALHRCAADVLARYIHRMAWHAMCARGRGHSRRDKGAREAGAVRITAPGISFLSSAPNRRQVECGFAQRRPRRLAAKHRPRARREGRLPRSGRRKRTGQSIRPTAIHGSGEPAAGRAARPEWAPSATAAVRTPSNAPPTRARRKTQELRPQDSPARVPRGAAEVERVR